MNTYNTTFPRQKVGISEKRKEQWYENCIDYVIDAGIACNDKHTIQQKIDILNGDIPNEFYKKTLNPYNSAEERFTRFPATMRNLDIMQDILRRYVSEYFKARHEFLVCDNNPEVTIRKNNKLKEKILVAAQQAYAAELESKLAELQQQAQQQGQDPNTVDPREAMPDPEQFIKDFNENYIDENTKQGQDVLDFVRSMTEDTMTYLSAYFDYCAFGECYTYTDIRGENLIKDHVDIMEAYPIPNSSFFVEDHDMFARKMELTYPQIIDMFGEVLTSKDRKFLEEYYYDNKDTPKSTIPYADYFEYSPGSCEKFTKEERELFRDHDKPINKVNGAFEVWHVVWKGEAKEGILRRVNEVGLEEEMVVDEEYKLNPDAGDISIDWKYIPQVYEGYRIGTRYTGIYPIKARPVAYQRNNKLPYNGIREILPNMGKFSIVSIITPYQILRNIISFHREMVIAKNKMLVLLIPNSLIASDTEDKLYKLTADNVLVVDDTEDVTSQKMANVRMLNANMGDYITQLTNLMDALKYEAREMVDMNMQRYGEIAQSAGQATTQEAVARSSMGSVIITTMFDEMRVRDYQRDLDFAKLAYIDGLQTSFIDDLHNQRYLSLDVNSFINSDLGIICKNNIRETEKLDQLRNYAFSAAQNGDLDIALAAITGNSVAQIEDTIKKFMEIKRQHEEQMQQAEQMLKEEELQAKLTEIHAKGEEDRLTKQMEYQYEMAMQNADLNAQLASQSTNNNDVANNLKAISEQNKVDMAKEKLNMDKAKLTSDIYNKAADREIKREQMKTQLQIAKTNKNKYDK